MKTKNNVQKAILKSVAVIISFVLISFTVSAQGSFKNLLADNSFGTIAKVLTEKPSEDDLDNFISITQDVEPALEIENWMLSNDYSGFELNYEVEQEPALELETWMLEHASDSLFDSSEESPLKLKNWMLQ